MTRRSVFGVAAGFAAATMLPAAAIAASTSAGPGAPPISGVKPMSSGFVKTSDGTEIFFKDWGPIGRPADPLPPWLAAFGR